jgi:hypothetical protein
MRARQAREAVDFLQEIKEPDGKVGCFDVSASANTRYYTMLTSVRKPLAA